MDVEQALIETAEKIAAGDAPGAYGTVRKIIEYPAEAITPAPLFGRAFAAFAGVARAMAGDELAAKVADVGTRPDDPELLFAAGYDLYEQRLYPIAATLFARANRLRPGHAMTVCELAACLEGMLLHGHAALTADASGLAETDPMVAYLSGFNWLMTGDLDVPRKRVAALEALRDAHPTIVSIRGSLAGMLARVDALVAAEVVLHARSLTAWHAALEGSVLLHESPHGWDTPMHGRYAYVADSPALMNEGLQRLRAVLDADGRRPGRIVTAPDRASRILGLAAGKAMKLPVATWQANAVLNDALVVAWSLDAVGEAAFLSALREHAPGQILFAHASAWVDPFPYAPDVTTFLHQEVTHPYTGGAMRFTAEKTMERAEPDPRPDEALAEEILASRAPDESARSLDDVLAIARALATPPVPARGGLFRTSGHRTRARGGSPVPSARFT